MQEAKAIVALAFRNGPIEDVHAGKRCPTCDGRIEFSHITDPEMKAIMKCAVDNVYELLCLRIDNPRQYEFRIAFGSAYAATWDEPAGYLGTGERRDNDAEAGMQEINRSAIIVVPKQPFLDWLQAIDSTNDDVALTDLEQEPDIYLVPECESDEEFERWIREFFPVIFEALLEAWWRDEDGWPKHRTFTLFNSWFEVRRHSLVFDLAEDFLGYVGESRSI